MLRGINVSGQKKILMKDLAAMYESLGFSSVRTYIQSGNVIFEDNSKDTATLEAKIKVGIEKAFGYDVTVMVRTPEYFRDVIESNPLPQAETKRLYVTFMDGAPGDEVPSQIEAGKATGDELVIDGDKLYFACPDGYGNSKLSNTFIERHLKVAATTRNWNSVNKLYEMAAG